MRYSTSFSRILIAALVLAAGLLTLPVARAQDENSFVGLGLVLDSKPTSDGFVTIVDIAKGAGDDVRAAVEKGDLITAVDGQSVVGLKLEEVVKRVRGAEGTTVKLTLKRPGEEKPIEVELKRRKIQIED